MEPRFAPLAIRSCTIRTGKAPDNGGATWVGPGQAPVRPGLTGFVQYDLVSAAPAYTRNMQRCKVFFFYKDYI